MGTEEVRPAEAEARGGVREPCKEMQARPNIKYHQEQEIFYVFSMNSLQEY